MEALNTIEHISHFILNTAPPVLTCEETRRAAGPVAQAQQGKLTLPLMLAGSCLVRVPFFNNVARSCYPSRPLS